MKVKYGVTYVTSNSDLHFDSSSLMFFCIQYRVMLACVITGSEYTHHGHFTRRWRYTLVRQCNSEVSKINVMGDLGPFYLYHIMSHRPVSTNERIRYICNVSTHWLKPYSRDLSTCVLYLFHLCFPKPIGLVNFIELAKYQNQLP